MALLNHALRIFIGLLIATLVISVATGVFFRYALQQSLHWATEVPNVLLIWIVFMGSVVAFIEKKHIAFTALVNQMPFVGRRIMRVVAEVIVLVFLVVIVIWGYQVVERSMLSLSDALKIPRGYFYICLPLSAALMSIVSLANLYQHIFKPEEEAAP